MNDMYNYHYFHTYCEHKKTPVVRTGVFVFQPRIFRVKSEKTGEATLLEPQACFLSVGACL